jgi:hypothetical protein
MKTISSMVINGIDEWNGRKEWMIGLDGDWG